jgi:hypothetical protein
MQSSDVLLMVMSALVFVPGYVLLFEKAVAWRIHSQEMNFLGIPTLHNVPAPNWTTVTNVMGLICMTMGTFILMTAFTGTVA